MENDIINDAINQAQASINMEDEHTGKGDYYFIKQVLAEKKQNQSLLEAAYDYVKKHREEVEKSDNRNL